MFLHESEGTPRVPVFFPAYRDPAPRAEIFRGYAYFFREYPPLAYSRS